MNSIKATSDVWGKTLKYRYSKIQRIPTTENIETPPRKSGATPLKGAGFEGTGAYGGVYNSDEEDEFEIERKNVKNKNIEIRRRKKKQLKKSM